MSITSLSFFFFCVCLFFCYFLLPKKFQWKVLLVFSLIFYAFAGVSNSLYIVITSLSAYFGALKIEKITQNQKSYIKNNKETLTVEEKTEFKKQCNKKKKLILILILLLNFGILSVFKYSNFALQQLNNIIGIFGGNGIKGSLSFIIPLGISFYTFQTMGYLIDVYWEKAEACKNPFKLLLFTSFFPQITQGPISDYNQLSEELLAERSFDYENFKLGFQRLVWGFFKKMAIADLLAIYVSQVFANYTTYPGITIFIAAMLYSIQLYADFSGYMDIVCGLSQMLGIKLRENFVRPFFSKSISEFWRRWHISLGAWFKNYLFYPIAFSKWNTKLGNKLGKKFGRFIGQNISTTIALTAVWLTTGLWHGADWGYIIWGGLNGLIIIFSIWMTPIYNKTKKLLKINEGLWLYRVFQVIRTFLLFTFIEVLPEVGTLSDGFGYWKRIFTNHTLPTSMSTLLPSLDVFTILIIMFGITLLVIGSLLQRKKPVREYFNKIPTVARLFMLSILIFISIVSMFYSGGSGGGFLYAQF